MTKQSENLESTDSSNRTETESTDGSLLRERLDETGELIPDDLTRYKTDELQRRFDQLFGVTHFLPWAGAGLGGSVVVLLLLWGIFFLPRAPTAVVVLTFVYMGLQGVVVGILAAALLIIARLFQQLTAIVDITIETLREALADLKNLGDPEVRAELTGALVHGAIVPAIQSAVTIKMGLLRAPIGFVFNWLLEKTAGRLTEGIREKLLTDRSAESTAEGEAVVDEHLKDDESPGLARRGDSHLVRMHDRIEAVARRTRRATLIPTAIVFAVVTGLSSIPWLVALLILV